MSTPTQTPITKEALIELGFESGEPVGATEYFRKQNNNNIEAIVTMRNGCLYTAEIGDISTGITIGFPHLKSIEQLKTIIEVCL